MLDLPNDCFFYLFDISYPSLRDIIPLFLTCNKLNSISDSYVNVVLNKDYKMIIRNNYLKTPKHTYNSIYKIYGNKFVMCKTKLSDLAVESMITNNAELLKLLHKTASNTMESIDLTLIKYYSDNNMNSPLILENIINKDIKDNEDFIISKSLTASKSLINNDLDKSLIVSKSLFVNDLDTLKLFINNENANDVLIRAIKISNIKASIYIIEHFDYDKNIVKDLIINSRKYPYMNQKMINTLNMIL
jgi:hypothetical protein